MKKITVMGVPMWLGQSEYGVQLGPNAIRSVNLKERLQLLGNDVIDIGNLEINSNSLHNCVQEDECNIKNLKVVRDISEQMALQVSEICMHERFPLILGGDHSIAIGTLAGISKHYKNLGVIWYDAHADSNTAETSPSGNIQGMPLAASVGAGHADLVQVGGYKNKIKPENIVLVGVRDIDPGEREFIHANKIKYFTTQDVQEIGIIKVMDEVISYLAHKCDGIHLSFDLDVIDPQDSNGVGTPVDNGIRIEENIKAIQMLAKAKVITSAEFVELNPLLDTDGKTVTAAMVLIQALFEQDKSNIRARICEVL